MMEFFLVGYRQCSMVPGPHSGNWLVTRHLSVHLLCSSKFFVSFRIWIDSPIRSCRTARNWTPIIRDSPIPCTAHAARSSPTLPSTTNSKSSFAYWIKFCNKFVTKRPAVNRSRECSTRTTRSRRGAPSTGNWRHCTRLTRAASSITCSRCSSRTAATGRTTFPSCRTFPTFSTVRTFHTLVAT